MGLGTLIDALIVLTVTTVPWFVGIVVIFDKWSDYVDRTIGPAIMHLLIITYEKYIKWRHND